MNLLLIEDDPVTCEVLSLLLAEDGWKVTTAESGEKALSQLQNSAIAPELILCDQKLPGLSGSSLAEAIRTSCQHNNSGPVKLFAISASRGPVPAGYDGLLIKPFPASEVRSIFERAQLRDDQQTDALAEQATSLPVIDRQVFETLQASMGTERLRELYAFAMADAVDRTRRMESAVATGNEEQLQSEAHMLKGAAGMVGARRLAALAAMLETHALANSGTTGRNGTKMAMLTAAIDDIERMLETLLPART